MLSVVDLLTYAVGLNTVYCNLVINILIIRGGHLPGKPKKKVWLLKVVGENLDIFSSAERDTVKPFLSVRPSRCGVASKRNVIQSFLTACMIVALF